MSAKQTSNLFSDGLHLATFSSTQKGNPKLMDSAGYEYARHKSNVFGCKVYWKCVKKSSLHCNARVTTGYNGTIISHSGEHIHPPKIH